MKRILIVTGPMAGHGGEEVVVCQVISKLSSSYQIDLLISDQIGSADWILEEKVKIKNLIVLNHSNSRLRKLLKVFKYIYKLKPNIIIAMSPRMLGISYFASKLRRKKAKLVSWLHFSPENKYSSKTIKLLNLSDANLVLTEETKKQLESFGILADKTHVVYNPVNRQKIIQHANVTEVSIVCIARIQLNGEKNLQELFHACASLTGHWQLHLYGSDDSKDKIETLKCKKLIHELNIESHIVWHGFVRDVWETAQHSNMLVLTSRSEGFPMVLCEAISRGIPVVSSNCPTGPAEIVNSENGFLYEMGDIAKLSEYLQGFVTQKYTFKGLDVAKSIEKFYVDHYMERLVNILENKLN